MCLLKAARKADHPALRCALIGYSRMPTKISLEPCLRYNLNFTSIPCWVPFVSSHITMFCTRCLRAAIPQRQLPFIRQISTTARFLAAEPPLSTPTTQPGESPKPALGQRSSCVEGTVLNGLNYTKGGQDPVALKDEEYPEWLWSCLEVTQRVSTDADNANADEFCMQLLDASLS